MTTSKSKRLFSALLAFFMLLTLFACIDFKTASASEMSGSWEYNEVSGGADIISYHGLEADIVIPAKLDNGLKVVSVSAVRPRQKDTVESVTFSSGIKTLGTGVLKAYPNLEKVVFKGSTVTTIGDGAFDNCKSLKSISLPSSVSSIGTGVFSSCASLTTANIKCRATAIPDRMFMNCSSLSNLTLPDKLTKIGSNAFTNCKKLKSVTLPSNVTTIGESAFENCVSLTAPAFPSKLQTIGEAAFRGCTGIKSVFIPNSVKSVKNSVFYGCTGMTVAYVSPSVRTLGRDTFVGCTNLEKIVFGGENGSFTSFYDVTAKPEIYYPSSNSSTWSLLSYNNLKSYSSYKATPSVKTLTLNAGKSKTVSVTVTPTNSALGSAYCFTTSDSTIATVTASGTITAKAPGKATITLTTVLGDKTDIAVTVNPTAPTMSSASPKSTTSIEVKWKAVSGATGYEIYRSTSSSGTYTKLTTATGTSYTDKGVSKGTTYYYKVKAYVKTGSVTLTSALSTTPKYCSATSPTPSSVTVTKAASGKAKISWTKSLGASGYEVFMATSSSGKYSSVGTTNSSTLTLTKTGLTAGKKYYFKVCSYTTVNGKKVYSPYSTAKSVTV